MFLWFPAVILTFVWQHWTALALQEKHQTPGQLSCVVFFLLPYAPFFSAINQRERFYIPCLLRYKQYLKLTLSTFWTGWGGGEAVASLFTWTSLTCPRFTTCASLTEGLPHEEGDSEKSRWLILDWIQTPLVKERRKWVLQLTKTGWYLNKQRVQREKVGAWQVADKSVSCRLS